MNTIITNSEESDKTEDKKGIIKNMIVVMISVVLVFATIQGLLVLQSTLNSSKGVISLSIFTCSAVFSCLFISSYVPRKIGCKRSLILSIVGTTLWTMANLYATWYTLIFGSLILGLAWGILWTSYSTFFTMCAINYAKLTSQEPSRVIARVFGFCFMVLLSGPIWGNLLSSSILSLSSSIPSSNFNATSTESNDTLPGFCGSDDCPTSNTTEGGTPHRPDQWVIGVLIGAYASVTVLSLLCLLLFLDLAKTKYSDKKIDYNCNIFLSTMSRLKDKNQVLLVAITVYTGMEQAYMTAEYTKSFVACSLGLSKIGFVIMIFNSSAAIMSILSGIMVSRFNRLSVFTLGIVNI
ncbi:DgyrCDS1639 [Dimorphilus gyrociliatus]|uniref:DgyrCDS1639 n=1 Tax=Dimorphilus gyrociliatus TaxID=2664684 RepID=A0A7I8V7U5_9ANNE|nr:DgyrCDS1639 [Dimorphilus gyrociliatus]